MLKTDLYDDLPFSECEYRLFSRRVQALLGIRLSEYKPDQMRRRLTTIAQQTRCGSFMAYLEAIQSSEQIKNAFLNHITINVTELVRNADLFDVLAKKILPDLISGPSRAGLNIWSAGCSYGAEAYTVSMILNEMLPVPVFKIRGTDVDLATLAKANLAIFTRADMAGVSPERKKRFFLEASEEIYVPTPMLRKNVIFSPHDLLSDDYQSNSYDLILCRNVVIYFNDQARERIYQNFYKALKPGGFLFVGGTERLNSVSAKNFDSICPFFYRTKKTELGKMSNLAA